MKPLPTWVWMLLVFGSTFCMSVGGALRRGMDGFDVAQAVICATGTSITAVLALMKRPPNAVEPPP